MSPVAIFFTQALILVCLPYWIWRGFGLRGLIPLVVIQILLGIVLGQTVLGQVMPELWGTMFSGNSLIILSGPAWLSVVLFAFLTGLHLQPDEIREHGRTFTVVSLASILTPTILGSLLGYWIALNRPENLGGEANLWQFATAIGICLGVTALPVLGAILREIGLIHQPLGRFTLGVAAINDAALWILLALMLVGLPHNQGNSLDLLLIPLKIMGYLAAMILLIRPMLDRGIRTNQGFSERELVKVCAAIFGSALIAESIGLHATVGGFIAGIIVPRSFARSLISRLEPITVVVLLPFFFTLTGMTTYLDFNTGNMLEIFLLATLTSMVGKFGGTALAARWLGEGWPVAITLGILMQTKGMMEVVILIILQDAHVISGACFSALLLMALTTTALTTPMLRLFLHFSPNPELRGNPEIPPEDS